jgi:type IX secretion system PorP/SprF family membrane protein
MARIIKTLFFILFSVSLYAQEPPVTNQYVLNPLVINPAVAGSRGALNIASFYRKQWVGIKGAPETFTLGVDAPFLDQKIGLGLMVISDRIGVTKENQINTNYSYKISMGKGNLSFGLGAGVIITNTAFSKLIALDPGDEIYLADSRVFVVPNFSFGIYYSDKKFASGFSIPRFLTYKFDFGKNKYVLNNDLSNYSYLLSAGYNFVLSQKLKFLPSTLLRYSSSGGFQYDINAYFCYIDKFWAGASYRNNRSVGGLFQFQITNQLRIAYTYDFDISKLGTYSNGSHEIMLRFEFKYKVDVVNPLIF